MTATSLNKTLKTLIISMNIISILMILYSFYFFWNKGIEASNKELVFKEKEKQLEYLEKIEIKYNEDKEQENVISQFLPSSEELSHFLLELEKFSKESGVVIKSITFPASAKKNVPSVDSVNEFESLINIEANKVEQIEKIMGLIEKNRRLIDIKQLSIIKNGDLFAARISLKAYYKNEKI